MHGNHDWWYSVLHLHLDAAHGLHRIVSYRHDIRHMLAEGYLLDK